MDSAASDKFPAVKWTDFSTLILASERADVRRGRSYIHNEDSNNSQRSPNLQLGIKFWYCDHIYACTFEHIILLVLKGMQVSVCYNIHLNEL